MNTILYNIINIFWYDILYIIQTIRQYMYTVTYTTYFLLCLLVLLVISSETSKYIDNSSNTL